MSFDKTSSKNLEDRFAIQLTLKSTTGIEEETSDNEISMIIANGIQIQTIDSELDRIELFDVMGRMVFRKDKIHDNTYLIDDEMIGKGFYLLKVETTRSSKSFKLIL